MNAHVRARNGTQTPADGNGAAGDTTDAHEHAHELAQVIRGRRRSLGLQQQDVADLAGVSRRFVVAVENGKSTAQLSHVLAVLGVLGLGLRVVPGAGEITDGTAA